MAKFRRHRSKLKEKIIIIIFLIITIIVYKTIYKNKKEIVIETIVNDLKYTNNKNINKYIDVDYILNSNFNTYSNDTKYTFNENNINNTYKILLYTTHETEKYTDNSLSNYNIIPDIKMASYILKDELNKYNIEVDLVKDSITEILKSNNWNYNRSYDASRLIIKKYIESNNYDLIIDLHRDSSSLDKTQLIYNDIKYAKTLFIVGSMYDTYNNNYNLSLKLNNILNNNIPNISKGISLKGGVGVNGIYNQDLSNKMVLIELGGQYNEIEEINNTIKILSLSIYNYLEEQ